MNALIEAYRASKDRNDKLEVNRTFEKSGHGHVRRKRKTKNVKKNHPTCATDVDVNGNHCEKNCDVEYKNPVSNESFFKSELPIAIFKNQILQLVNINSVVIIHGPTGCGKTTQVPQYLLDNSKERRRYCNIVVAQPTKLAALDAARRLCEGRKCSVGNQVGYELGAEKYTSPHTHITCMTTGGLLQKIIAAKSLDQFTHIVIDEIEERSPELNFLLIVIRKHIFGESSKTKIILISSTIWPEDVSYYFIKCENHITSPPASIINIYAGNQSTSTTDISSEKLAKKITQKMDFIPLERLVLQAKMLHFNETPLQILSSALNPPNLSSIERTIVTLQEIGALLPTLKGGKSDADGDLTFLGIVMAILPIDVRLSKLIVLGHLFGCVEEAIIIAAGCSVQNIFLIPIEQKLNAYKRKLMWADGSSSDLIVLLNIFQAWQSRNRNNEFEDCEAELQWCIMNFVDLKKLKEWSQLVTDISESLESINIKVTSQSDLALVSSDVKPLILNVVMAGAFYPNYFVNRPNEGVHSDEYEAVKAVDGRDPIRTIYFSGMDPSQPGPLYARAIKHMLQTEDDSTVGFNGSGKVFIKFNSLDSIQQIDDFEGVDHARPGKIPMEVYAAIRKRQLNHKFCLKLLPVQEAWKRVEENGFENTLSINDEGQYCSQTEKSHIPSLDTEWIMFQISEHIDASYFWAITTENEPLVRGIAEILRQQILCPVLAMGGALQMDKFYAAKYHEDGCFYRCKVVSFSQKSVQVLFIDYGQVHQVEPEDICYLPETPECNGPPLSIRCVLYGIKPSRNQNPRGIWTKKNNDIWKNQTAGVMLHGKIHSVVDDVFYLELYTNRNEISINQLMLLGEYAEPATETFLSKLDHEKRRRALNAKNLRSEASDLGIDGVRNYFLGSLKCKEECKTIQLEGPHSPLEMKVYGCTTNAANKIVEIGSSSLNTVLLNPEPGYAHSRLLVAGFVCPGIRNSPWKLFKTSLLPAIPGLPMLLSLLFCPTMEIKCTDDGTRPATIICGLGYNKYTDDLYRPTNDLMVTLDTNLTPEELIQINLFRCDMKQGLQLMSESTKDPSNQAEITKSQKCLRNKLRQLILFPREPVDRVTVENANIWEKQ